MKIPTNFNWTQLNNGDLFGSLNETHNLIFEKKGVVKLNQKAVVHQNDIVADGGDVDFEQVMGIEIFDGDTYAITDDGVFKGDLNGNFLTDTGTVDLEPSTSSVVVYDRLYVGDGTNIHYYNGSAWTTNAITGLDTTSGNKRAMCSFDSLPNDKLAIADKNEVKVYDSSHVAGTALVLPSQYIITSLAYQSGYLYVGTKTDDGVDTKVFIWDGSTANANYSVPVGASWVFALTPYQGTVAGITNEGEVFLVNGTSKKTLGTLPIYNEPHKRWYTATAASNGRVLSAGMTVIGDSIYITLEGEIANNLYLTSMKNGIWCYDPQVGLYHYATPTVDVVVRDTGLSLSSNEITTSANHELTTGDAVQFISVNNLTGVNNDIIYYAIVTGADTLKLAANRKDADLGNALVITGTPDATDILTYAQNTDKGAITGGVTGAIKATNHRVMTEPLYSTDVVFGYETLNISMVRESTLQGFCDSYNVGWFTTQKMYSSNISENWKDVFVYLNGALTSNEKIIVKYRTQDESNVPTNPVSITWTNATVFTTSDFQIRNNVKIGDEIMITEGQGQGQLAHITAIDTTTSDTVTTVTIDESYGSAAAAAVVVVTGFKKTNEVSSDRESKDLIKFHIGEKSTWIQIKVEMRGFGIEVAQLEITNATDKSAT